MPARKKQPEETPTTHQEIEQKSVQKPQEAPVAHQHVDHKPQLEEQAQPPHEHEKEQRGGVLHISDLLWSELFQEHAHHLHKQHEHDTLTSQVPPETIKERLLLPKSYTVTMAFYKPEFKRWNVVVSSPDLPVLVPGKEYPVVVPVYEKHHHDGSTHLLRIDVEQ